MTTKTDTQAAFEAWLGAHADDPTLPHDLIRDAFLAGIEAERQTRGQPAVGEEIHVHIEGLDVLTLPLASSGIGAPRFVVHVPAQPDVSLTPDVQTDRQGRMPSDEEIDKLSHGFALQYQDHVRGFARALLSRYSSGKPDAVRCNHCGWRGADADLVRDIAADEPDDGAADVCPRCKRIGDLQDSGQPAASAEPVAWLTPGMDLHLENPEGFADWVPLYAAPVAAQTAEIARLRDGIEEAIRLLGLDRPIDPTDTLRVALSGESKC